MRRYRCKRVVEAMHWSLASSETTAARELLIAWHEKKTGKTPWFLKDGIASVFIGDNWYALSPGEWLMWDEDCKEFLVMENELFVADYEESP